MIDLDDLKEAARRAVESYNADIFLYSGPIEDDSLGEIAEAVTSSFSGRERCILILATNGGSANGAFQIARFFQRTYEEFILYCPGACKSAGTLVALGANILIMDQFSELGPLDVQIAKDDEIGARKSGLLATSTFEALAEQTFKMYEHLMMSIKYKSAGQVSFKLASQLAATMTAETVGQLYAQMNPDVIGSERRSLLIAKRYGDMLVSESENAKSGHTVDHLVSCYPSHDFVIDDTEARKLFRHVYMPTEELYTLTAALGKVAQSGSHQTVVLPLIFDEDEDDADVDPSDGADAAGAEALDESGSPDSGGNEGPSPGNDGGAQPSSIQAMHSKRVSI